MRRLAVLLFAVGAGLAVLALVAARTRLGERRSNLPQPGAPTVTIDGQRWRLARAWDFAAGDWPGGWRWGEWRLTDQGLEGRATGDSFAVYVCPLSHGGNFLLEARLGISASEADHEPEAHLLTRDSRDLHCESGVVLFGGEPRLSVRHMVGGHDRLLRIVTLEQPVTLDQWHELRFICRDGRVTVSLDGKPVFASAPDLPVGVYGEPHLAVRCGVVRVRSLRILVAS